MVPFLADEDFNGRILRGLRLQDREIDIIRVQDIGLSGAEDPAILEAAEQQGRILLTHDARTMPRHVGDRLKGGNHMPGVLIVDDLAPIGRCIDDILLLARCSELVEWMDQIVYLPFD